MTAIDRTLKLMTARLGIELSPSSCRIVELDGPATKGREPRVRSFAVLPLSGGETRAKLQSLRGRTAAAVVWNVPAEHRQVVVTGGTFESMRAEALASLDAAGLPTHGVVADIAPIVGPPRRGVRQPVVVALASSLELTAALEPLRTAGIRVKTVTTPAMALTSIARQRRAFAVPGAIEAYVALEQNATCIALVRDAVLVAAHTLTWGYADAARGLARPRDDIAAQLADAVTEFVGAIGGGARDIGQVCVCGGLPELRGMTLPLMERLDVEVEPLDSLFGMDAGKLPQPADEFLERSAELRLAWAAAADGAPPINLLRAQRRRASRLVLARAAVAAGVVAGLAAGLRVEQSQWWRSTAPKPAARASTSTAARGRAASVPPPAPPARPTAPPVAPAIVLTSPPAVARTGPPPVPPDVGPTMPPAVEQIRAAATTARNKPVPPIVPPADAGPTIPAQIAQRRAAATSSPPPATPARAAVTPPAGVPQNSPRVPLPATVTQSKPPAPPAQTTNPHGVAPSVAQAQPQGSSMAAATIPAAPARPPASSEAVASAAPRAPATAATRGTLPPARTEPLPSRAAPAPPTRTEPPPLVRNEPASSRLERPAEGQAARPAPSPAARGEVQTPRTRPAVPRATAAGRGRSTKQEVPVPFDAVLGTILYSPDRKLAIVDDRIVGIGDQVRGARITGITPVSVLLRDGQGRLRQLTLGATGR